MAELHDVVEGREGPWMQLSSGGRFWPADPRPGDVFLDDIAAGLGNDCRYAGQLKRGCFYSVAEHSVLMMRYARDELNWTADQCMCVLLHDATEAYLNDLPRAVKREVGPAYQYLEDMVMHAILVRFDLRFEYMGLKDFIKDLDRRIVPTEKKAVMNAANEKWAFDAFKPLPVTIRQWQPQKAQRIFMREAITLLRKMEDMGYPRHTVFLA